MTARITGLGWDFLFTPVGIDLRVDLVGRHRIQAAAFGAGPCALQPVRRDAAEWMKSCTLMMTNAKKTQKTPRREIEMALKRAKEVR